MVHKKVKIIQIMEPMDFVKNGLKNMVLKKQIEE